MNNQAINISQEQIHASARAGIDLLNRDSTLVPGSLRRQLAVLEVVLGNILNGNFVVVPSAPVEVELGPQAVADAGLTDKKEAPEQKQPADTAAADTGAKTNGRSPRKSRSKRQGKG